GGVTARAQGSISTGGTVLHAGHTISFVSDGGAFNGAGSVILPFAAVGPDTHLSVTTLGLVDATLAHWFAPAGITVQSTASNVTARLAVFQTTGASGQIAISAAGGTI